MGHLLSAREGRGGRRKKENGLKLRLLEFFIKFCLGERRFTESEIKGESTWGPREMIIFHARFSFGTECGLQIRKLWLGTIINSAGLCQRLVPCRVPHLPAQQRQS